MGGRLRWGTSRTRLANRQRPATCVRRPISEGIERNRKVNIKQGALVASAVALLLGSAACAGDEEDTGADQAAVKCQGINECAGTSECAGPDGANDCQGMNECAGQGWVSVDSEAECTDQGGNVIS